MASHAENRQIGDVVRSTARQTHDVIALPHARLKHGTAALTLPMSTLESMLTVTRILRILVGTPVRVPFVANLLVNLRLMQLAVIPLRGSATDQARPQTARANLVGRAPRGTVRGSPPTDNA